MLRAFNHITYTDKHYFKRARGFPFWSFIYLRTGTIRYASETGIVDATGPTFFLRQPNSPYVITYDTPEIPCSEIYALFVQPEHWAPLLKWPSRDTGIGEIRVTDPARLKDIEACLLQACSDWNSFRQHRSRLAMNLLERALIFLDEVNPSHSHLQRDPRIVRALEYIQTHYRDKLTIRDLAKIACLSLSRFADLFKAQVGLTPMQQVEVYRLGDAAEQLLLSRASIEEIGFSVGFENAAHFSIRFKNRFKSSPRRYREIGQKTPQ